MYNLINGSNHAWPTRKPWLNQAYHASEVGDFNQIYQKTLVEPGLPGFWGGKFQPGPPRKPGNTRLTKHFWLGFLSRDLSYQVFNQTFGTRATGGRTRSRLQRLKGRNRSPKNRNVFILRLQRIQCMKSSGINQSRYTVQALWHIVKDWSVASPYKCNNLVVFTTDFVSDVVVSRIGLLFH